MQIKFFLKEFGLPLLALILFFFLQARGVMSELELTVFILALSLVILFARRRIGEVYLFGIGTVVGLLLEVGFRFLGYQQSWTQASLFGIPFWLPLAWGIGFVLITRVGIYVRDVPIPLLKIRSWSEFVHEIRMRRWRSALKED